MPNNRFASSFFRGMMLSAACCTWTATPCRADPFQVAVSFNDQAGTYSAYYSEIVAGVQAAGADWAGHIANTSGTLRIQVNFDNEPTASAGSVSTEYVGTDGANNFFRQGALARVLDGYSAPGSSYDAVLNIGSNYLANTLWFDPNPTLRTAPIPTDKIDAESVFIHEFTHMLVFNGFQNQTNGTYQDNGKSTFDRYTQFDGSNFYFDGSRAEALYGGPVPLTYGNIYHVGNNAPRPGSDLIPDLMNGVVSNYQTRYDLSALDLAMAADTGVPIITPAAVPEPGSMILACVGLLVSCGIQRTRATLKLRR